MAVEVAVNEAVVQIENAVCHAVGDTQLEMPSSGGDVLKGDLVEQAVRSVLQGYARRVVGVLGIDRQIVKLETANGCRVVEDVIERHATDEVRESLTQTEDAYTRLWRNACRSVEVVAIEQHGPAAGSKRRSNRTVDLRVVRGSGRLVVVS